MFNAIFASCSGEHSFGGKLLISLASFTDLHITDISSIIFCHSFEFDSINIETLEILLFSLEVLNYSNEYDERIIPSINDSIISLDELKGIIESSFILNSLAY